MPSLTENGEGAIFPLAVLENLIRQGPAQDDFNRARAVVRTWLFGELNNEKHGNSIGDAVAALADKPQRHSGAAAVLLRCLAVPDLLPPPNSANQLARNTVALCEGAIPGICEFIGLKERMQNYEKLEVLSTTHDRVAEILSPMAAQYVGIDSIHAARPVIMAALNHGIVRGYCRIFRLTDIRGAVEILFNRLNKVAAVGPSLVTDIDECRRAIEEGRTVVSDNGTFLAIDFLTTFIDSVERALEMFITSTRGRFSTAIVRGGMPLKELQKRYPLHEAEREIVISVPLRNIGPGLATNLRARASSNSEDIIFNSNLVSVGNVLPGDFSIGLDALVLNPTTAFDFLLEIEWGEMGALTAKTELFEISVIGQRADIDWTALEYWHPYSTAVAEGQNFVGRGEKLRFLTSKLLRFPMEPFYITGQKRVGKTSLALAVTDFATKKSPGSCLVSMYILWGKIAYENPRMSLRALGESIEGVIFSHLSDDKRPACGSYDGSLADLLKLSDVALREIPDRRFVIVIDEFDEIPQDLFLQGNLAETFFGNLRALTASKNICLVLVGGENMPFIINRQGQKLNKFSRTDLDYFSRDTEWDDYKLLVRKPADEIIEWHDDAVAEIYNLTNGNPYFTKLICAAVLRNAVRERDADVTAKEVRSAVETEISTLDASSFAHLWQDGIFKPVGEREPDILRRMAVLVAIARCLRRGIDVTSPNIADNKFSSVISEAEILPTLNDFVRRSVLRENSGVYEFALPLFRLWLMDVGATRLVSDPLSEELARSIKAEEDAAHVKSEEVAVLARTWPTYRGRHIGTDDIRTWLQQVDSNHDQRILFKLLSRLRFLSEAEIREKLRTVHGFLRPSLPQFITRKASDRRKDVLITYVDGEGKSGQSCASQYAEENRIAVDCIISPATFRNSFLEHERENGPVAGLVIVDDIASTGGTLAGKATLFIQEHADVLVQSGTLVFVVTLLSTASADERVRNALSKIDQVRADFRSCEILDGRVFAFKDGNGIWSNENEAARAKALCTDLGVKIYKKAPLGYGNQGLLVVFPTTVPNTTLPILHSYSRISSGRRWTPLFERIANRGRCHHVDERSLY
jgi:AAA+ ATPase superfamily predicted ATPase